MANAHVTLYTFPFLLCSVPFFVLINFQCKLFLYFSALVSFLVPFCSTHHLFKSLPVHLDFFQAHSLNFFTLCSCLLSCAFLLTSCLGQTNAGQEKYLNIPSIYFLCRMYCFYLFLVAFMLVLCNFPSLLPSHSLDGLFQCSFLSFLEDTFLEDTECETVDNLMKFLAEKQVDCVFSLSF